MLNCNVCCKANIAIERCQRLPARDILHKQILSYHNNKVKAIANYTYSYNVHNRKFTCTVYG